MVLQKLHVCFKTEMFGFSSGRFAARDLKQTVAVGVIKSVEKVDQAKKAKVSK